MNDRKEFEFQVESLEQRTMLSSVQIFAAGDMGDEAFELIINGKKQATYNLHGTQEQVFTFKHSGSVTADDVRIQFINDKFEPENGIDRNLRIDKIVIDGVTFETEDPSTFSTGTWKAEDGITPGFRQSEVLNGNGFFQFSSGSQSAGSELKIRVRGDEGTEQFNLIIKGEVVGTFNATTQDQTITFQTAEVIQASDVRIEFINDVFDPANGIDANLIVDFISIDGKIYQTEAPTVFSTGTWRAEDGITPGFRQSETLNGNGFFQFGADPNMGGGVTGSEIQIRARGDEGTEKFNLLINGQVVGTFNVTTADQTITYRHTGPVAVGDVRIEFINDVFDPANGIDANLIVDFISIDGEIFQTEAPTVFSTGTWRPEDGITPGFRQSETLNGNGFFQYGARSGVIGSEVLIRARGDEGTEKFNLLINGQVVGTFNVTTTDQTITYRHTGPVSPDDVRIEFINDVFDPANGIDANLIVDFISIDGTVYQTEDPSVFSTGTWRPEDGITPGFRQSETLNGNGFFQFSSSKPAPNQNPIAAPDRFTVVQGSTITGNVGANDSDPDGDDSKLVYQLVTQPASGQITFNSDGSFSYIASGNNTGEIKFTYSVTDERGGTSIGEVTLVVSQRPNQNPIAAPDRFTVVQGSTVTGNVGANDSDPDGDDSKLVYQLVTQPASGQITFNSDGSFSYIASGNNTGEIKFTYSVTDERGGTSIGEVTLVVSQRPNQSPIAAPDRFTVVQGSTVTGNVGANDSDPDGDDSKLVYQLVTQPASGQITFNSDGSFSYIASGNNTGEIKFTYSVTDERGGTSIGEVTLVVSQRPNQAPIANPDRFTVTQGQSVTGNVGANDSDPDGDDSKLVYQLASQPASGQLTFNADGSFVYVASGAAGDIRFTYTVTDERGGTSNGEVTLTVNQRVPAPVEITVPSQGGVATGVVWELKNIDVAGTKKYPFPNGTSGVSTHDVVGGTFTIKLGTTPVPVGIVDNDGRFNDNDLKQVLANNVTINGVSERAGNRITPEYSYQVREAGTGRIVNIYIVELGSNKSVGIVSDAPLQTGVAYTFNSLTSNKPDDLTYNRLARSYIILA